MKILSERFGRFAAAAAALIMTASLAGCGSADDSSQYDPNHIGFTRQDSSAVSVAEVSSSAGDQSQVAETSAAQTEPTVTTTVQPVCTETETTPASTTTVTTAAETKKTESPDGKYEINAQGQKEYIFSDKYESFLQDVTFVGDSICYGLEVYDYMPPNNVLAFGSVAARNIFDFTFDVDDVEYSIIDAVKKVQPKILIFSMGMNDINLTTPDQYCENYMELLDQVHEAVPSAKLYVASITPISNSIEFNDNTTIDGFNAAIKQYLANSGKDYGYVDIASYLKDEWNGLAYEYSGGDGIHLQSPAYSAILYQVCEQLCK